ncbi:MAG: 50S ribosomal protein L18e [Candidatus Aenigmatarchaeota archaeon]
MKVRNKNDYMKALVEKLYVDGVKNKSGVWKAVAESLNRPTRVRFEVNLTSIEKLAQAKETLVVPGIVLGSGQISKHVNVAALKFSGSARQKIEKAGGTCLSIEELYEKNPKGKDVRIIA